MIKTKVKAVVQRREVGNYVNMFIIILISLQAYMQIEEEHPSTLSLNQLLSDPHNRVKIIRVLYQALTAMGYHESAEQLQKQTNIFAEDEPEFKIKKLFAAKKYKDVAVVLQSLKLPSDVRLQVNELLTELELLRMIQEKEFETAVELIAEVWPEDENKQERYFTIIATDQFIKSDEISSREAKIIEKCTSDTFELKETIQKLLKGYVENGENANVVRAEHTFKKIAAESSKLTGLGKVSFVKLNPKANLVCLICQTNRQTQISIWNFEGKHIVMEHHWKLNNFGSVQMISWNNQGQNIAICSHTKIASYAATKISEPIVISSREIGTTSKLLCCKWHPEGILFFGGLFDYIFGVNQSGHVVRTIRPFIRTRDMLFLNKQQILAISATRSQIQRYDMKEEKVICQFTAKAPFMDMHHDPKSSTVIVTNRQYIYFLNADTLQSSRSLLAPSNDKMYKIQVFFVKNWLIVFNQKLTGLLQNFEVTRHHMWPDCDAVDVRAGKMVTVKSNLVLWEQDRSAIQIETSEKKEEIKDDEAEWYSQDLEQEQESMHSLYSSLSSNDNAQIEIEEPEEAEEVEEVEEEGPEGLQIQSAIQYLNESESEGQQQNY